jgi:hypothetical protein
VKISLTNKFGFILETSPILYWCPALILESKLLTGLKETETQIKLQTNREICERTNTK